MVKIEFLKKTEWYFIFLLQGAESATSGRVSSSRSRASDEPHIGKYKLLKTIGKGNFAKVKLAKHVPTGKEVRTCRIQLHLNNVQVVVGITLTVKYQYRRTIQGYFCTFCFKG